MRRLQKAAKWVGVSMAALVAALALLVAYWYLRPNRSLVNGDVVVETWDAAADGMHNSNTDMVSWEGDFYLVYASSPFHFASEESRLILSRSADGRSWQQVATFDASGEDIRDPKLAVIQGRLFLYALKNTEFTAEPYTTVYSVSDDGVHWTPFREIRPRGWLFWRPKSPDGQTWYVPAYWHDHGRTILLSSSDGIHWRFVSLVLVAERSDETDIEFLPDGRMIATARVEVSDSYFGDPHGSTLITVSAPPFREWSEPVTSLVTRLDGPSLFTFEGQVYAVGRYQPNPSGPFTWQGSIFSRKRTSLFLVRPGGMRYLTDLPSAGDTSYSGIVLQGETLLVSYYTSDIRRDYPWLLGMVTPSSVRIAEVDLVRLASLSSQHPVPAP